MGRRSVLLVAALVVAALGTTMVFFYVNGVNDRALEKQNPYRVLVAKKAIEPGTSLKDADNAVSFQTKIVSKDALVPRAVGATTEITGKVATTWIYPGEQIIPQMFGDTGETSTLAIPPDKLAISVVLNDPAQIAGFVDAGTSVAIFLTAPAAKGSQEQTLCLLPKVLVLAIGSQTSVPQDTTTTSGTGDSVSKTILTIAVDQKEYQKVVFATTHGKLNLGLLGKSFTPSTTVPPTTQSNLFD